jgi:TnpA family transposase
MRGAKILSPAAMAYWQSRSWCARQTCHRSAWTSDWHIRDETYLLALRCLVNQQQREPFAAHFGGGMASSSDGQFFQAAGYGRAAANLNAHYGHKPGFKAYTHLSDRYGPFYTKPIAATASEALHVLDALLYHQSEVAIRRHHTDGDSDHVFALCTLVGLQFAPRIPDLKHRRLYSFAKPSAYPALEPMIAGRINVELIRAHWSEILRLIASIRTGTVTALLIMRQGRPAQRVGKQWRIETVPRSSGCNRSSSVTFLVCRLMRTRRPLR